MTQQEFYSRYSYNPRLDALGKGGFGAVFKAYDNVDDRYVALKISQVDLQYPELRLREEVRKAKDLLHPNVARYETCYTFPTSSGEEDIAVMRYYEAGSLETVMRTAPLRAEERYDILRQILNGIDYLHTHNIIHRDLKPQNVLIVHHDGRYIPKITDFGISKQLEDGESSAVSNSVLGGTRAYASPEQLAEKNIRKNTDLWSFGVLAYQMLTGELPFNSGTFSPTSEEGKDEQSRQMRSGILPELLCNVAEPWQRLIRGCLVVDNIKRLEHVEDCLAILDGGVVNKPLVDETQLEDVVAKQPEVKPHSDEKTPLPPVQKLKSDAESKPNPKRKMWWLWLLLLAIVGIVFGIVLSGGDDKEEEVVVTPDTEEVVEITAEIEPEPEPVVLPDPILTLTSKSSVALGADGGSGKVAYTLTNPRDDMQLSVKSNANWVSVSRSGDTLSYNAPANNGESSRSAKITVAYGDQSFEVVITQAGKPKPVIPEVKTYKIGDYYNENGKRGVVFEVWDGGRHGKIVSLDDTRAAWDSRVKYDGGYVDGTGTRTYADSKSDGKSNTDKIMSRSDSDYFPAFKWCRAKGSSWYLPALNELKSIYKNKSTLNATLQKYGTTLKGRYHWTSTEYVDYKPEFCAWIVHLSHGIANYDLKYYGSFVRAVSAF